MNILPYLELELLRNNDFMRSGLYNTQNDGKMAENDLHWAEVSKYA